MATLYRLVIRHGLLSGAERADNTYHFLSPTDSTIDAVAASLVPLVSDYWLGVKVYLPTATTIVSARVESVDITTGKAIAGRDVATPITTGAGGVNALPTECAVVVSLRSGLSGGSYRGRVFLPNPSTTYLNADGSFTTNGITAALNGVEALLEGANATLGADLQAIVWSPTRVVGSTINSIDCGKIIDAMRSRRRSLAEARTVRPITT